jgi:hypothetical protein
MNEASVAPIYPDDDDDREAVKAAVEAARLAGRGEAWRLLVDVVTDCRNPALRLDCLRYVVNSAERKVAEIAKRNGVSIRTVLRELRIARRVSPTFQSKTAKTCHSRAAI